MSAIKSQRCLVLNQGWSPVGTVTLQRAIVMLFQEYNCGTPKAKVIDHETFQAFTWDDWSKLKPAVDDDVLRGAELEFRIPEVILLTKYNKIPKPKVHFSRRNLFKRDEMTCQYCGGRPGSNELTIDHVLPRSQGGDSSWENCVLACVKCNSRKADKTPQQAKMPLLKEPKRPRMNLFKWSDTRKPIKSWEQFIGTAYWNVDIGSPKDEQ